MKKTLGHLYYYFLILIHGTLLIIINSCDDNNSSNIGVFAESSQDSTLVWIKLGKNKTTPIKERKEFLQKAFLSSNNLTTDSLKTAYFSKLSLAYLDLNDSIQFRQSNRQVIILAKRTNDSLIHAEAHWDLAHFFSRHAVRDSAFYHYAEAQKIFDALDNNFLSGRMYYNMAVEQSRVKDYIGSEISTIKAIELLQPLEKYKQLYNCYNTLGAVSKDLGEYDKAIKSYNRSLEYAQKLDNATILQNSVFNNIGNIYKEQGLHSKAIPFYEKALSYDSLLYKNPKSFARASDNLGNSKLKIGEVKTAESLLVKALKIRDSIGDIEGVSKSHYSLSEYYFAQKDTATALMHAQKAKEFAKQSSNNKRLLETLELITLLDPKNATTHSKEYIALNDSLQREEHQIRNKFARIQFETDEFIAQNQLLAGQRQLWIGIAGGLLLLALSVFIIISQRIKNQKLRFEQEQQKSNEEIFNLMLSQKQKMEEGKQSEQKRISEELHDGVLGEMNGIRMVLLGLNKKMDENAVAMRSKAIEKLQEVQEEIRTISHELNDASYQKFHNFITSIQDLLKSVGESAQIAYTFDYDEEVEWDDLRGDLKINLYRIVQESLMNCVKHAKAKNISLNFESLDRELKISLIDDGKGFDTRKGKKGIGHKNIRSRIDKLKGTWNITSAVGKGTTVYLQVPYRTADENAKLEVNKEGFLQQV